MAGAAGLGFRHPLERPGFRRWDHRAAPRALPNAEFVDCTALLDAARYIKSAEEIAFLERGVALAEHAIRALYAAARPGVAECAAYAKMIKAMVAQGGELPAMIMWTAGAPGWSPGDQGSCEKRVLGRIPRPGR